MSDFVLTISQQKAINHTFPSKLQITGGPGTGKTMVLKQIYNKLVLENQYSDILVLLFDSESITKFTESKSTIPQKNFHVFTLRQFWFSILRKYIFQTKNINLIQLSQIDFRYLKNKFSSGSINEQNYLKQQQYVLFLNSFEILQMCQKYYKEDFNKFQNYLPKYKYILIDEFQDVDLISFNILLDYYKSQSIIVSGDDDQSLFSWTKMTVINSMKKILQKLTNMQVIELEQSFRCTENILVAGQNLLKPIRQRIHKKVISKNKYNRCLYLKKYSSDKKQAQNIARQIKLLNKEKQISFNDIGVLCRRRKLQNNIIRAMKRFDIPIFRQNLGMDSQVEVIISIMRLYLNKKDFMAKDIVQGFLKFNSELYTNIKDIENFVQEIKEQTTLVDFVSSISKLLRLGVNRSSYTQFMKYLYSFSPQSFSLKQKLNFLVRQTEIYSFNQGVSVISSLSTKGLEFRYIFIPGFNYYNYRYNSEQQQSDVRKILYSTICKSSDFVCVSYFNVMNPLGLQFTKLQKKVMQLQMKHEEQQ